MIKKYKYILLFILFSSLFFIPRFFTHLQYDALEDEILSVDIITVNSISELLVAPDATHPPLWYLLMKYPTNLLSLSYGIGPYRLIQVLIMFGGLLTTTVYFWKKIPRHFISTFLLLFLTNTKLIHLTSQHSMYSLVLSFGVFYVFSWIYLTKYKKYKKWKDFVVVGVIASLGFFSNYSMIWLIPVFPLEYLLSHNSDSLRLRIKNLLIFTTTFFVSVSWFIPIFIKNSLLSINNEQWAASLNAYNVFQLFTNYFGIIPIYEKIGELSIFTLIFIAIFLAIIIGCLLFGKKKSMMGIFFASIVSFSLFLLTVFFTGNRLLYTRTSISLVLAFYVFIAGAFGNFKFSKLLVLLIIIIQLSQFFLYFNQYSPNFRKYYFVDYKNHPIKYFVNYDFYPKSCLVVIPVWNFRSASYFLSSSVRVVPIDVFNNKNLLKTLQANTCKHFYLLEQSSLNKERLRQQYLQFFHFNFSLDPLDQHANQNLYSLNF